MTNKKCQKVKIYPELIPSSKLEVKTLTYEVVIRLTGHTDVDADRTMGTFDVFRDAFEFYNKYKAELDDNWYDTVMLSVWHPRDNAYFAFLIATPEGEWTPES